MTRPSSDTRDAATAPASGAAPTPAPTPVRGRRVLIAGRCAETVYRQRRMLARHLRDSGWDVHLCGDDSDPHYIHALSAEGFTFHPLALDQKTKSPLAAVRLILAYRRIVRAIRPDVVHVFNAKPTIMGLIGATLGGCRVRVATIAGLGHIFMARSRLMRLAGQGGFRGALALADAVVFYNEDDRRAFVDRGLTAADRTHLIRGSGIDLDRFAPVPLPPGDQLEILFVGRLLLQKGIGEVIAAARDLRDRGTAARVTVVGEIDRHNPSSLTQQAIEAAVAERAVAWQGGLHDVVPAIAASHVVILPSHREGIPLALVEGGAMGRALVATDVPGCRDVVQHEDNGLLVPMGDAVALADALDRLATDRAAVERYGRRAIGLARARFGAVAVSGQVAALYAQLLGAVPDRRVALIRRPAGRT